MTSYSEELEWQAETAARRSILNSFKRVAPHFRQLRFTQGWAYSVVEMIPEQLALAGVHSPHLELLEIAVASHDNQAWEEVMQVCKWLA